MLWIRNNDVTLWLSENIVMLWLSENDVKLWLSDVMMLRLLMWMDLLKY